MEQEAHDQTPESSVSVDVFQKIGTLTRQLHDALNELGHAEKLQGTMQALPDARSRLSYIARLTGDAAEKVLNLVDQAKSERDEIASEARRVKEALVRDPVAAVARGEIMNFLDDLCDHSDRLDTHLTEIMLAQDFHDLTGQVISRVVNLAASIEDQLVELLLRTAPSGPPGQDVASQPLAAAPSGGLCGPVVDATGRTDVVTSQTQVDDLLASLGF